MRRLLWRWRFFAVPPVALLALGFLYSHLYSPGDRITKATCDQIKKGMTEDQVSAIVGQPTKSVAHRDANGVYGSRTPEEPFFGKAAFYGGNPAYCQIIVYYGKDSRVISASFYQVPLIDRFRRLVR